MLVSLGGLCIQSGLKPLSNLISVLFPLLRIRNPVIVDELRVLQAFEGLGQVDAPLGGVGIPYFRDGLAPDSPIPTGGTDSGERRERRAGGGDGFPSDVGVVVVPPLISVLRPGIGCQGKLGR